MTSTPTRIDRLREFARSDRLPLLCFVLYVAAAYPAILFHYGANEWFNHDDWNFLVDTTVKSMFTPYEHHWSTIPIVIYRLYYHLFGANYFPFLATVAALHLTAVSLLRVVMRRCGVNAWIATIAAAELVLFGPGYLSIVFAIQITQNISLVMGTLQMILADHDGKIDRRDRLGLACGVVSLMSSGLAPILVIGVGISTLLRRGWKAAAFHTVPLGALFVGWFLAVQSVGGTDLFRLPYSESRPMALAFLWHGTVQSLTALVRYPVAVSLVPLVVAVGLWLRFRDERRAALSKSSMALALFACTPVYFGIIGMQRSRLGMQYVGWGHHLYTWIFFFLPVLAIAIDALTRRWKITGPVAAIGLSAFIPLNAHRFGANEFRNVFITTSFLQQNRRLILAIAHSPYAQRAQHLDRSRSVADAWYGQVILLGWALDEAKAGRLPNPGPLDQLTNDYVELFYGLTDLGPPASTMKCEEKTSLIDVRPQPGDLLITNSPVIAFNVRHPAVSFPKLEFYNSTNPEAGHVVRVELPDLHLELGPAIGSTTFGYCAGSPEGHVAAEQPSTTGEAFAKAVNENPATKEELRKAIQADPAAMEALRRAIQSDPAAMEALRKEMAAANGR